MMQVGSHVTFEGADALHGFISMVGKQAMSVLSACKHKSLQSTRHGPPESSHGQCAIGQMCSVH